MEDRKHIQPEIGASATTIAEHRDVARRKVLKSALAAFNDEFSTIPCLIRNISDTGARLAFDNPGMVPRIFVLHVEMDGFKVPCERVWQAGKDCGVRFTGEKKPVRVMRSQVLKSSQEALSERTMRDYKIRAEIVDGKPQTAAEPEPVAAHANPKKPAFGRRG